MDETKLPLNEFVLNIAREAAREVIREHKQDCSIKTLVPEVVKLKDKMNKYEGKWMLATGLIIGSGIFGGVAGTIIKVLLS